MTFHTHPAQDAHAWPRGTGVGAGAKGREGWSPDGPTELGGGHVLCWADQRIHHWPLATECQECGSCARGTEVLILLTFH